MLNLPKTKYLASWVASVNLQNSRENFQAVVILLLSWSYLTKVLLFFLRILLEMLKADFLSFGYFIKLSAVFIQLIFEKTFERVVWIVKAFQKITLHPNSLRLIIPAKTKNPLVKFTLDVPILNNMRWFSV